MAPQALLRDLGDGLTLRAATAADAESLATFVGDTLRAQDGEAPDHHLADWTRDLLEGRHQSFTPDDATDDQCDKFDEAILLAPVWPKLSGLYRYGDGAGRDRHPSRRPRGSSLAVAALV